MEVKIAKISPVSIKYMIHARFEAEGTVEKPDVIGAIFGQTEGLLGTDLEMRDLQKEGKIGRIEVEIEARDGKTHGSILIPSALDKTETTLIAASIETIDRIGPSNASVQTEKIEDIRENKREYILERAKKLLESVEENMPRTKEMTDNIRAESRISRLKEYGDEKLPAGNLEGNEIIVVEGRADVINLLKNNVDNVIGMNGTILPETIKELSRSKSITLFLDGDRGGRLIAKNVAGNAKVDYIAFAPDGKEVEELPGKEILVSLRKRVSAEQLMKYQEKRYTEAKKTEEREDSGEEVKLEENFGKLRKFLDEVENSKSIVLLDNNLEIIGKTSSRSIFSSLEGKKVRVIVVDKATPMLIRAAEENDVKSIVAKNFAYTGDTKVHLVSL